MVLTLNLTVNTQSTYCITYFIQRDSDRQVDFYVIPCLFGNLVVNYSLILNISVVKDRKLCWFYIQFMLRCFLTCSCFECAYPDVNSMMTMRWSAKFPHEKYDIISLVLQGIIDRYLWARYKLWQTKRSNILLTWTYANWNRFPFQTISND